MPAEWSMVWVVEVSRGEGAVDVHSEGAADGGGGDGIRMWGFPMDVRHRMWPRPLLRRRPFWKTRLLTSSSS